MTLSSYSSLTAHVKHNWIFGQALEGKRFYGGGGWTIEGELWALVAVPSIALSRQPTWIQRKVRRAAAQWCCNSLKGKELTSCTSIVKYSSA